MFARHWDSGACKGLLGHTRAQVYRYRVQTVCMFFGGAILSLLCFVPVLAGLILSLPCVLWVKCCSAHHQAPAQADLMQLNRTQARRLQHYHSHGAPEVKGSPVAAVGEQAMRSTRVRASTRTIVELSVAEEGGVEDATPAEASSDTSPSARVVAGEPEVHAVAASGVAGSEKIPTQPAPSKLGVVRTLCSHERCDASQTQTIAARKQPH